MRNNDLLQELQTLSKKFSGIIKKFTESPVIATKASTGQLAAIKNYGIQRKREIEAIQSFYEQNDTSKVFFSEESSLALYNGLDLKNTIGLLQENFIFLKKTLERNYNAFMQYFFEYGEENINKFFEKKEKMFSKPTEDSDFLIPEFFCFDSLNALKNISQGELEIFLKHSYYKIEFYRIINTHTQNIATLSRNTNAARIFHTLFEEFDEILKNVTDFYNKYNNLQQQEPFSTELTQLFSAIENKLAYLDTTYKKLCASYDFYQKLQYTEQEELLLLKMRAEFEENDADLQMLCEQNIDRKLKHDPIMEDFKKMEGDLTNIKIHLYCAFENVYKYKNINEFRIYIDSLRSAFNAKKNEMLSFFKAILPISKLFMMNDRFFAAQKRKFLALQKTETEMSFQNGANPV